jgi:hypothetical protein
VRRASLSLLLALAGACSYYNGMYNTEQLASRAEKAEREGRPFDAQSYWSQVSIRAESALVHHPRAGWADRARLLQGTALARVNACDRAIRPLEALMLGSQRTDLVEQAALLLGDCRLKQSDAEGATEAFGRLVGSTDARRRSLALYYHGRALRLGGQGDLALNELRVSTHPRARGERAAALATLGRIDDAEATADSLLMAGDTLAPWGEIAAALGAHDPEAASRLTDRLAARTDFPATLRARLLLTDGLRWLPVDTGRSERRFHEADSTGKGTPVQAEVRYQLARAVVGRATTVEELRAAQNRLEDFTEEAGAYGASGTQLGFIARRVVLIADSLKPGTPNGDLRAFLAGELARDSLGAEGFAAGQFRRVAQDWPASPFAPKALLALLELQVPDGDSVREALRAKYADSPYLALVEGRDTPGFAILEDSLQRFTSNYRPESRRAQPRPVPPRPQGQPPPQPARPQPATPRQPADN